MRKLAMSPLLWRNDKRHFLVFIFPAMIELGVDFVDSLNQCVKLGSSRVCGVKSHSS
jgi:hypothetical protein